MAAGTDEDDFMTDMKETGVRMVFFGFDVRRFGRRGGASYKRASSVRDMARRNRSQEFEMSEEW